jgi:hypothetical protein
MPLFHWTEPDYHLSGVALPRHPLLPGLTLDLTRSFLGHSPSQRTVHSCPTTVSDFGMVGFSGSSRWYWLYSTHVVRAELSTLVG